VCYDEEDIAADVVVVVDKYKLQKIHDGQF
jgi:hypothetical protein